MLRFEPGVVMNDEKSCVSRALQLELLVRLRDVWPRPMREFPKIDGISDDEIIRNLVYLEEHRLCSSGLLAGIDENYSYGGARITAIGLDFLEDDGGLSAILKTVTIKVHADTLRDMFNSKIETSALPQTEKSRTQGAHKITSSESFRNCDKRSGKSGA